MPHKPHYFILDHPIASPAKCGLCGYSGSDRRYLDPRLDFEFYGTLIFCESCVGTMANDFEFSSPLQTRSLENRVKEAERELEVLRAAVLHLENAHDALDSYHSLVDGAVPHSVASASDEPVQPIATLTVGAGSISDSLERLGDIPADEPVSEQRPNDLSDDLAAADELLAQL